MGASMAAHLQKAGFQPIVHDMHQDTATQEVLRYYQQAEGIAEPIAKANPTIAAGSAIYQLRTATTPTCCVPGYWSRYNRLGERFEHQSDVWNITMMRRLGMLVPRL